MAVRTLDRTVLMRDAAVVAGWFHAVVAHELLIAAGEVLLLVAGQVAEGRREAVAAVLFGHGAERPQRVLQTLRERNEALPAEDDVSVLPAAIGQAEVIEQVVERFTGDADAEVTHAGEVGQPQPARHLLLTEDHVLLRAVVRLPHADAPLQCTAHIAIEIGMSTDDLVKDGDRAYSRRLLEHRHDLALPHVNERIGPAPTACNVLLRWQPRIGVDPIRGGLAEPGLRSGDGGGIGLTGLHVQPRLAVGDVLARQVAILLSLKNRNAEPSRSDRPDDAAPPWGYPGEKRAAGGGLTSVGLRPPSVSPPPDHSHPD